MSESKVTGFVPAPILESLESPEHESKPFYNVPGSTASNLYMETLGAGENIGDLPDRKRQINNNTRLEVYEDGIRRQIILENPKAQMTIELSDIEKITGSNKAAKKLFVLALIKANEQAIFKGQLTKDYVSFPLKELIQLGFYATPQSARKGFNSGMDTLTSLKLKGRIWQTSDKGRGEVSISALEVLFTGAKIKNGQCTIYLNHRINWAFIAQYYTILPMYYFKLSNNASDLLYYIFYLARQNIDKIKDQGSFTIGFRSIQHRLQLPSEVENDNPNRTIKQPIDDAIEQIELAHSKDYGNTYLSLVPVCNENDTIKEYLDNGYLKVSLSGAFISHFIEISKKKSYQIEQVQKRKKKSKEKKTSN